MRLLVIFNLCTLPPSFPFVYSALIYSLILLASDPSYDLVAWETRYILSRFRLLCPLDSSVRKIVNGKTRHWSRKYLQRKKESCLELVDSVNSFFENNYPLQWRPPLKLIYFISKRNWFLQETLHKKWSFPLRISSVNVTKSAGNCIFGHIYWRNP